MFNSLKMIKAYMASVSDAKSSKDKVNGRVYVHLTRDSKDAQVFTVKLETNAFSEAKACDCLRAKYYRIVDDLRREGYRTLSAEPFGLIRVLNENGLAVYCKTVTFCERDL